MSDLTAISRERVLQIVFDTIDEINEILPEEQKLEKRSETHLFDKFGKLDSIGLVNFVVFLEQRIGDEFGMAITLADEKAFSRQSSPFRTVDSITDYVIERLNGPDD